MEENRLSTIEAINEYTTRSTFIRSIAELNDSGTYFCKAIVDGYSDLDSNTVIVLVQGEYQNLIHIDLSANFKNLYHSMLRR